MLFAVWTAHQAAFGVVALSKMNGTRPAFSYYFYTTAILFVAQVSGVFFFAGVTFRTNSKRSAKVAPMLAETSDLELGGSLRQMKIVNYDGMSNVSTDASEQTRRSSCFSRCLSKMKLDLSPGRRYYTDLLTMLNIYLYLTPELSGVMNGASILVIWLLRIAVALLYFYRLEQPTNFDGLLTQGTGFGLVADAKQLKAALRAHLNGGQINVLIDGQQID
eukprot:scaffold83466_cov37-Prasinocladus_malaysianus.AAC.2